jgi:acyl-CoA synthetase (AMP-forming)/AMP-acid ligase II
MGEKVGAVLFADAHDVDVTAVLDHCGEQLADFKVPQYISVVTEALPRTPSGKLRKDQLREQVQWGAPLR